MVPTDRAIVVVFAGDRAWRAAVDTALRQAGMRTRLTSRPAELAKSLADAAPALVVAGPTAADHQAVRVARADGPVLRTTPGDTITEIVRRVCALLVSTGPAQATGPTSSE
ncbi:MAG: hypothetical protein ACK54K_06110 [Gemmatimonadaceae bacterium]